MKARILHAVASIALIAGSVSHANGQAVPPECVGMDPEQVVDLAVVPAIFKDLKREGPGFNKFVVRGQFLISASTEFDLGPEADQQQISLIFTQRAEAPEDEVELFSETLTPQDFETRGRRGDKFLHRVSKRDAGPDDQWRKARFSAVGSPGNPPIPPGSLNRFKFSLLGFPDPALDLIDGGETAQIRMTMRVEPSQSTCATDPDLCLCLTFPLACVERGGGRRVHCFSSPTS